MAQRLTNLTRIRVDAGFHPWPCSVDQGSGVGLSCVVGHRCSSDPTWLWLWCRPVAVALIRPLAWELPYATGVVLKSKKKKKKKKKEKPCSDPPHDSLCPDFFSATNPRG